MLRLVLTLYLSASATTPFSPGIRPPEKLVSHIIHRIYLRYIQLVKWYPSDPQPAKIWAPHTLAGLQEPSPQGLSFQGERKHLCFLKLIFAWAFHSLSYHCMNMQALQCCRALAALGEYIKRKRERERVREKKRLQGWNLYNKQSGKGFGGLLCLIGTAYSRKWHPLPERFSSHHLQ